MAKKIKVSDESLNSYNLRIKTSGIELGRFQRNPIMLFNHHRSLRGSKDDILPIGTWMDLVVEGTDMFAVPVFDMEDEFAAKIAGKYERNVLSAASIGIYVKEVIEAIDENGNSYYLVTKCELREISLVDIPSNEFAVAFYDENDEPVDADFVLALAAESKTKLTLPMTNTAINGLLGLSADADEATQVAAIKKLQEFKTENTELKAKNAEYEQDEKDRQAQEITTLVDAAAQEGRIEDADKETYVELMTDNFELGKKVLAKQTKTPTIKEFLAKGKDGDSGTGEMTFSEMRKNKPDQLMKLKTDNPDAFNELYKSEFGVDYKFQ